MNITRRRLLAGASALAAAGTITGFPAIAQIQMRPLRIGVFISEQDAQGVDEMVGPYMDQLKLGVEMAVAEINAADGILGRQLEVVYVNDLGSPPSVGAVGDMITGEGVEAIIAGFVQASPRLIATRAPSPVPILSGFWSEGTYCGEVTKFVAPTAQQIVPSIREYLSDDLETRPFTITNWTPSGRNVSSYLYGALGAAHTGDALVTTPVVGAHAGDFRGVLRWAHEMETNIIWTAEPRPYSVNVVNQAVELGLAEGKTFAYFDFSELQTAQLAPGGRIVTCLPFVSSDPDPRVQEFVSRIKTMPGAGGVVTHVAFTHYNAIKALQAAMEKAGEASSAGAIAGFEGGLTIDTATGPLAIEAGGYATMPLFLATAEGGGTLQAVQRLDAVPSRTTCG